MMIGLGDWANLDPVQQMLDESNWANYRDTQAEAQQIADEAERQGSILGLRVSCKILTNSDLLTKKLTYQAICSVNGGPYDQSGAALVRPGGWNIWSQESGTGQHYADPYPATAPATAAPSSAPVVASPLPAITSNPAPASAAPSSAQAAGTNFQVTAQSVSAEPIDLGVTPGSSMPGWLWLAVGGVALYLVFGGRR